MAVTRDHWLEQVRFSAEGLVPVVAQDRRHGTLLMLAWADRDALARTLETGQAHYWSRSRQAPWRKGESSGHTQRVVEMRTDCDQDAVWIRVEQADAACHTGRRSCFYRKVEGEGGKVSLAFVDAERLFDPNAVYRK